MQSKWLLIGLVLLLMQSCSWLPQSRELSMHGEWLQTESEHYVYYYRPNSAAETDIDQIKTEQERVFARLNEILGTNYNQKIHVYIFNDLADAGFTDKTGQAFPIMNTIEVIYGKDGYTIGKPGISAHEVTHIITFNGWGPTDSRMLSEGIAVYMEYATIDKKGNNSGMHMFISSLTSAGELPDITSLAKNFDKYSTDISYPVSGSFVGYLVGKYGMKKYRTLFIEGRSDHFVSDFERIYGIALSNVESAWRQQSWSPVSN